MGSIAGLESGVVEAVEHTGPFLDEPDSIALSESVLAPKPRPRPKPPVNISGVLMQDDGHIICDYFHHRFYRRL